MGGSGSPFLRGREASGFSCLGLWKGALALHREPKLGMGTAGQEAALRLWGQCCLLSPESRAWRERRRGEMS